MIYSYILIIMVAGATIVALPLLFLLRHMRLHKTDGFAKASWHIFLAWGLATVITSFLPIDYWHNPPFKKIICLPKKAEVLSCYTLSSDNRAAYGNPWPEGGSMFDNTWFHRRGLGKLIGQNMGESTPSLESIALQHDRSITVCVFEYQGSTNAIIAHRSHGGGSGDNYITLRLFQNINGAWKETTQEEHSRSDVKDVFTKLTMVLFFACVLGIMCTPSLLVAKWCGVKQAEHHVPITVVFIMLTSFVFLAFAVVVTSWLFLPALIRQEVDIALSSIFTTPFGYIMVAYGLYRTALLKERKSPNNTQE